MPNAPASHSHGQRGRHTVPDPAACREPLRPHDSIVKTSSKIRLPYACVNNKRMETEKAIQVVRG
jgi:hypothetical protein